MAWANGVNAIETGVQTINNGVWTGSTTTQYNVLVGDTNNEIANVAPSAQTGYALLSNGAAANPSFQPIPFQSMPLIDEAMSFSAVAGNAYYVSDSATASLPSSPSQGDEIQFICGDTAVVIQADGTDLIQLGNQTSTAGGTLTNVAIGDCITLKFQETSTTWWGVSSVGNWTPA